jgi:hypothetical protein
MGRTDRSDVDRLGAAPERTQMNETVTTTGMEERRPSPSSRRSGYLVAVVVNTAMIFVVLNLLDWGVFPFLTEDFTLLVPLIMVSLLAGIMANLTYLAYDPPWFKTLCQVAISLIGLVVAIRMYQIFPFDFTGYGESWPGVTRMIVVVAMVGSALSVLTESLKFLTRLARRR